MEISDKVILFEANTQNAYNEENNPVVSYLDKEVDNIEECINNTIPLISTKDYRFIRPYIFLSDAVPKTKTYGKYTTKQLIKLFFNMLDISEVTGWEPRIVYLIRLILDKLNEILVDEKNIRDSSSRKNIIAAEISHLKNSLETASEKAQFKKVEELIGNWKHKDVILGEYLPDRNQIILYQRAIEKDAHMIGSDPFIKPALYSMVLAHEYFHAYHHMLLADVGVRSWNKLSKDKQTELKESLADYFSVYYCMDRYGEDNEVAVDRIHSWCSNFFSKWPYSKALCYLLGALGCSAGINSQANVGWADIHQGMICFNDTLCQSLSYPEVVYEKVLGRY